MEKTTRLRKSLLFLVMMITLSFGDIAGSNQIVMVKAQTVYVTRTGSKYHTHKCGNGTYYASSLSDAIARGLTACKKCFPYGAPSTSSGNSRPSTNTVHKEVIKINATEKVLIKGQTAKLKITGTSRRVTWKTSNKSVVTVDGVGKITAKKKGSAVITAEVGSASKKCKVIVEEPKLSKTNVVLETKKVQTIKLRGCKHFVSWSSSNTSVARVKNGTITAVQPGNATITARVHGKKFKCKVKVNTPKITAISLSSTKLTMNIDDYRAIRLKIEPSYALKYYKVSAKSSDNNIVRIVDIDGGKIYLESYEKAGSVDITIKVGNETLVCKVTVEKPPITSLRFSNSSVSLKPNESEMLWFDVEPFTVDEYYDFSCESSNENIVKVVNVSKGIVDIEAGNIEGEASVTLKVGNKTATCRITVAN